MFKRTIHLICLLISIGIILFIFQTFYAAFTQQPSQEKTPLTVQGELIAPSPSPVVTSNEAQNTDNLPVTNTPSEESPRALDINPALRAALPPIPEAPTAQEPFEAIALNPNTQHAANSSGNSVFPSPISSERSRFPSPSNTFPTPTSP